MPGWLKELDDLLRGNKTQPALLASGTEHLRLGPYVGASIVLGAIYGASMGFYAALNNTPPVYDQLLASAVKVPALLFLSLAVVFPSLYVFSALLRARLDSTDALRIGISAITVNLAVLASLAPITAFFTLATSSYPFMKLLSVFFFTVAGLVGMVFLVKTLGRLEEGRRRSAVSETEQAAPDPASSGQSTMSARDSLTVAGRNPGVHFLFRTWLVLYVLVTVQMAWILRPLIGAPEEPFAWFMPRGGNALSDFFDAFAGLFGQK